MYLQIVRAVGWYASSVSSFCCSWSYSCSSCTEFGVTAVLEVSCDLFTHQLLHPFGFGVNGINTMFLTVLWVAGEEGGTVATSAAGAADKVVIHALA